MTTQKRTYKAIQLDTALVLVLPQSFVADRKVSRGDIFEAFWSSDSSIIVYKMVDGGKAERERLAAIARLKREIEAIDSAKEVLATYRVKEGELNG